MNIIFDLDGTMWDSTEQLKNAWNRVLEKNNTNMKFTIEDFKFLMGKTNKKIYNILEKKFGIKNLNFLNDCQQEEVRILKKEGAKIYSFVIDTLKELSKKHKLFIVSNCQNGYIESFLEYYKLNNFFKDFICSDTVYKNKIECMKTLLLRNNINNFYYIGDTNDDYLTCKKLNGKFIFASYGFGHAKCKNKISNFKELLNYFN